MTRGLASALIGLWFLVSLASAAVAADEPSYSRTEDVVYGRKFGTALTMDVFKPKQDGNGLGVILVVSGGWFSSHDAIRPGLSSRCSNGATRSSRSSTAASPSSPSPRSSRT